MKGKEIIKNEQIEDKIIELRGVRVILDADVAALYEVETKEVNQAVKNNPKKFPNGYVFTIDDKEKEEVKNFDHLAKSKFSNVNPKAFTEAEASSLISSAITLRQAKPNRSLS